MTAERIPAPEQLPSSVPTRPDHAGRRLCRWLLRMSGWQLLGEVPDCGKLVLIVAPHSSFWDGFWGLLMKVGIGLDVTFMGKQELFRGPLGWLLRRQGAIPVDRAAAKGVVEQMTEIIDGADKIWFGIAPEGTRKRVAAWKTGFWRIAHAADVPILPVAFHYPGKAIYLGPLLHTREVAADMAELHAFYAPFKGKYRDAALTR